MMDGAWRITATMDNGDKMVIGAYGTHRDACEVMKGYKRAIADDIPFIGGDDAVVSVRHMIALGIEVSLLKLEDDAGLRDEILKAARGAGE